MKSPITPRQRDRRLVFALFLAATFGMMIVLSFPLVRFLPGPDRIPGLLGLPSFLDPLRPLLPPPPPVGPTEVVARAEVEVPDVVVPIPPRVVGPGPGPVADTPSPKTGGRTAPDCRSGDSSGRKGEGKARPGKGHGAKSRAGAGRRCRLTSPPADAPRTNGPTWTIPRHKFQAGRAVTKHGPRQPAHEHHKPKKDHKRKGK